jgi:predicted metal-binding membrane protein
MFGLIGVIILAWVYTVHLTSSMGIAVMGFEVISPHEHTWTSAEFYLNCLMWSVMQIAMMAPTAAPMLLFYTKVSRERYPKQGPYLLTGLFLIGYLIVWIGFSVLATFIQWGLHTASLLSTGVLKATPIVGGILLISAGVFQFSHLKNTCLTHCRTPVGFIMTEWRDGKMGALIMGILHGGYCVGCCWLLMALLFVAGVMNLLWMVVITFFVLVEKIAPGGDRIGKYGGVLFFLWGIWMIFVELI